MSNMFASSLFNGDISQWNTERVTDMRAMFYWSVFNGDLSQWDTSSVRAMNRMFSNSVFNGDVSRWNTSLVGNMQAMFRDSPFQGDLSGWDTAHVDSFTYMFSNCPFSGDISSWVLQPDCRVHQVFDEFHLSPLGIASFIAGEGLCFPDQQTLLVFDQGLEVARSLGLNLLQTAQYIYGSLCSERMDIKLPQIDFS